MEERTLTRKQIEGNFNEVIIKHATMWAREKDKKVADMWQDETFTLILPLMYMLIDLGVIETERKEIKDEYYAVISG